MASYASQSFPARNLMRFKKHSENDGGAWLTAYREEQKRRFEAVLCPEKNKVNTDGKQISQSAVSLTGKKRKDNVQLNGIFLLKECNVEDPSDIISIKIIGRGLVATEQEDFVLFDNVSHIEAGENHLHLDSFKTFPILSELELQLNNVDSLNLSRNDFPHLRMLDLSYNNITEDDFLSLGVLPMLTQLHLTGNGLKQLPVLLSKIATETQQGEREKVLRNAPEKDLFEQLQVLHLDENEFADDTVFYSLACLRRLNVLNLSNNRLQSVPYLGFQVSSMKMAPSLAEEQHITTLASPGDKGMEENQDSSASLNGNETREDGRNSIEDFKFAFDALKDSITDLELKSKEDCESHDQQNDSDGKDNRERRSNKESLGEDALDYPRYPFVCLQKLDLSRNAVKEEGSLLSLATWPNLIDVNISENPLTRSCNGVPPLLHHELSKLCGIKLHRKTAKKAKKPAIGPVIAPSVRCNKIEDMPVIKRSNLLMLEFESYETALKNGSLYGKPLPPIGSDQASHSLHIRNSHSAPAKGSDSTGTVDDVLDCPQRPSSVAQDRFNVEPNIDFSESKSEEFAQERMEEPDGVFLTQIDAEEDENLPHEAKEVNSKDKDQHQPKEIETEQIPSASNAGYDCKELLKIEGLVHEIDTPPAEDIRGNIKALQHALLHPLVFNDPKPEIAERQIYTQHKERPSASSKYQGKSTRIDSVVENMQGQQNIIEENLDLVLERYKTDPEIRKKFPEVKKLLGEVQSKYNKVRLRSLENASNAQKMLQKSSKPTKNKLNNKYATKLPVEPIPRYSKKDGSLPNDKQSRNPHLLKNTGDIDSEIQGFKTLVEKRI